jgi:hypothetical protein
MLLVEGGKKGRNGEEWEEFIPVGSLASSAWLVARTYRAPGDIGGLEVKRVGRVEISNGMEIQNVKRVFRRRCWEGANAGEAAKSRRGGICRPVTSRYGW